MLKLPQRVISIAIVVIFMTNKPVLSQINQVPIQALADSMRLHPKPALILISTDWCTYCQMQQGQLVKNKDFQDASKHFYFSVFNAEIKDAIMFNGIRYHFQATGASSGLHDLAYALGNTENQLAFPTWVVINEQSEVLFRHPGVLRPDALKDIIEAIQKTTDTQYFEAER